MAKRISACGLRHRLGNVGSVGVALALLAAGLGQILQAADSAGAPPANAITAALEYQEVDYSIVNRSVSITPQTGPFKTEPAVSGKTVRGRLNFGGVDTNAIPFVWQRNTGKLFLDLNRNQDLTDDPAGVFSTLAAKSSSHQSFTGVHLVVNSAAGQSQMLADLNFWDYSSRLGCSVGVRSFWQGQATLQGQDWQVGIIQDVFNSNNRLEGGQLLLRPWAQRGRPFTMQDGSLAAVTFAKKIFLGGHAYQLETVPAPQDWPAKLGLQFTEQTVALGEINITGKFIQRMVLSGGPYLVILDQPAGSVKIPVGTYHQPKIRLEQNGTAAYNSSSQSLSEESFPVNDQTPATLNVGGPLTNSVMASRHGNELRLDYRLIGAGGATYQMAVQNHSQPPTYAVYKGDQQIASGKFEFG